MIIKKVKGNILIASKDARNWLIEAAEHDVEVAKKEAKDRLKRVEYMKQRVEQARNIKLENN